MRIITVIQLTCCVSQHHQAHPNQIPQVRRDYPPHNIYAAKHHATRNPTAPHMPFHLRRAARQPMQRKTPLCAAHVSRTKQSNTYLVPRMPCTHAHIPAHPTQQLPTTNASSCITAARRAPPSNSTRIHQNPWLSTLVPLPSAATRKTGYM
ncbi:hypothetical protein BDU57DRAFT_510670 [Ampelomyces quisqualis]|uniref:Uncharacterized protein n=1 Tax=Ampelomyces quisqualis TaxID=50730 RepID=A0A6A5R215_AMPQU|nr:hypothetical protein BDU57DRAFT_510670 [Ampelomyces quisqualis]